MNIQTIFGLQFVLSIVAWGVTLQIVLLPRLRRLPIHERLAWLALPHTFRHIGLVFLVPGVVDTPLPEAFANPAAYGDLLAGLLALAAVIGLSKHWASAIAFVWVFNIVGTLDLANALRHAEAVPSFGAAWFIPTFLVPLLVVTHFLSFKELLGNGLATKNWPLPQ